MVGLPFLAERANLLAAASYSEQASVGSWPLRIGLTLAALSAVLLVLAAFRRGWHTRREAQTAAGIGVSASALGAARDEQRAAKAIFRAKYIGTAKSDDRFTRIVAGGGPARAQLLVSEPGIEIVRQGEAPLFVAAESIISVGSGNGLLQKAYARHGLLMVTWQWDQEHVTSGFWLVEEAEHLRALAAIEGVTTNATTTSAAVGPGTSQGGQQ